MIKRILNSEWALYKDLRLSALKGAPEAFGSKYEDAKLRTDQSWQEQVGKLAATDEAVNFMAYDEEQWVGMVSCYISDKSEMVQMWVEPSVRGKNIGKNLVHNLIAWLKDNQQRELHAVVYDTNIPALKLYLKLGFENVSTKGKEIHLCYKIN